MEEFNELLKELKNINTEQTSIEWDENIPEEIWNNHFKGNFKELKSGLEVDTRRWYETSISVIEIYSKPLGIKHITNLFSESSSCEDCYVHIEFFEMEEITIKSYKRSWVNELEND
jgi:hypothetical protein